MIFDILDADFYYVGLHKTASTFVYRQLMPMFSDSIASLNEKSDIEQEQARASGKLTFWRCDSLSGRIDAPDLDAPRRIAKINPSARIIISLRSQHTALRSMYWLAVKGGASCSFPAFVERLIDSGKLDYLRLVKSYWDTFGRENVLVLLFEEITEATDAALARLAAFLKQKPIAPVRPFPIERASPPDTVILACRVSNMLPAQARTPIVMAGYLARRIIDVKLYECRPSILAKVELASDSNGTLFSELYQNNFAHRYPTVKCLQKP